MIYIYTTSNTDRLTYILDFFFKSKGKDYTVLTSKPDFIKARGGKINYSHEFVENTYQIIPEGLLLETQITKLSRLCFQQNTWLINQVNDVFSTSFYMLTTYEEYLKKDKDTHYRFSATHSSLNRENRLDKPNVDLMVKQLWEGLELDYSEVQSKFNTHFTFDIDSAWAIKNKGVIRSLASDVKDLLKGKNIKDKFKVRIGGKQDPFDTYSIIKTISKTHPVTCFFLLGDWGRFDKNIHWKHKNLNLLINDLKQSCSIGIHPSYASYLNTEKVKTELTRLHTITTTKETKSRQHFLKLDIPKSYQLLENIGITDDYTMGFADAYGFRSGTCFSYPFFDLSTNTITTLTIHPITYMDGTFNQYLGLSTDDSITIIQNLKAEVKNVGGTFCPLWHNETIGEVGIWKGWRDVFESNF